jgi:hypothetical protein
MIKARHSCSVFLLVSDPAAVGLSGDQQATVALTTVLRFPQQVGAEARSPLPLD